MSTLLSYINKGRNLLNKGLNAAKKGYDSVKSMNIPTDAIMGQGKAYLNKGLDFARKGYDGLQSSIRSAEDIIGQGKTYLNKGIDAARSRYDQLKSLGWSPQDIANRGKSLLTKGVDISKRGYDYLKSGKLPSDAMLGWQNWGRRISKIENPFLRNVLKVGYGVGDVAKEYLHGNLSPWRVVPDFFGSATRQFSRDGIKASIKFQTRMGNAIDGSLHAANRKGVLQSIYGDKLGSTLFNIGNGARITGKTAAIGALAVPAMQYALPHIFNNEAKHPGIKGTMDTAKGVFKTLPNINDYLGTPASKLFNGARNIIQDSWRQWGEDNKELIERRAREAAEQMKHNPKVQDGINRVQNNPIIQEASGIMNDPTVRDAASKGYEYLQEQGMIPAGWDINQLPTQGMELLQNRLPDNFKLH